MRITLIGQPYAGKSVIASGQECVNLYAEINQKDDPQSPAPITYYPFAGTEVYADPQNLSKARGCYRTSVGTAYYVIGPNVYFLTENRVLVPIGFIPDSLTQVYFADNGIVAVLVDGTAGWVIDLTTNEYAPIADASFYGADFVLFLDTFFVFNRPRTNQFYISLSNVDYDMLANGTAFDALDIAAKSGFSDPIVGLATVHRELWLIGRLTSEVWIGTGAADFYFQQVQGAFINHGCAAPYSIANTDIIIFFLMQDQSGSGLVVKGSGYDLTEISTPRIVEEFKSYTTLADAIGFCFQVADHAFYCVTFPTANKTWLYDIVSGIWTEWNWIDDNGNFNRSRANCAMFVYNENLIGDWENGKLLKLDINKYTDDDGDNGEQPIVRVRTFPHQVGDNQRIHYSKFSADMEVGETLDLEDDPQVALSWSNDKGKTYSTQIEQSLGKTGQYLVSPSWNRLGQARDRIFKLQWSANCKTALNGGFIEVHSAKT